MSSKLLQLQGTFVSKELERKEGMLKKTLKWHSKYKPYEIRWVSFFFSKLYCFDGCDNATHD